MIKWTKYSYVSFVLRRYPKVSGAPPQGFTLPVTSSTHIFRAYQRESMQYIRGMCSMDAEWWAL